SRCEARICSKGLKEVEEGNCFNYDMQLRQKRGADFLKSTTNQLIGQQNDLIEARLESIVQNNQRLRGERREAVVLELGQEVVSRSHRRSRCSLGFRLRGGSRLCGRRLALRSLCPGHLLLARWELEVEASRGVKAHQEGRKSVRRANFRGMLVHIL